MFGIPALKYIVRGITKHFVTTLQAVRRAYAAIKARIMRQYQYNMSLAGFTDNTDVEAAREKWGSPRISCLTWMQSSKAGAIGVERIPSEVAEKMEEEIQSPQSKSIFQHCDRLPLLSPTNEEKLERTSGDCDSVEGYPRKSRIDTSRKPPGTPTRVDRARADRQSILFGDGKKLGLITSAIVPLDTSLDAPNMFARSEPAQRRIRRARAIRRKALFNFDTGAESLGPVESDSETYYDIGDVSFSSVESECEIRTPPHRPAGRARVVCSGSYGGSINYSVRLGRNCEELTTMLEKLQEMYGGASVLIDSQTSDRGYSLDF